MSAFEHDRRASSRTRWDMPGLAAVLLALFVPFLGVAPLFDWDEANFAEAAREMLASGDYLRVTIGFEPFFEKPPLFFWLQATSMAVFGVNEWAARLPGALAGTATMLLVFRIGASIYDRGFGFLWVLAYTGSILPGLYFRTGIIDPVFNLLMFLSIWNLIKRYASPESGAETASGDPRMALRQCLFAGLFSGLAVLAKGPVGFGVPALCWAAYWLACRRSWRLPVMEAVVFTSAALVVGASWFVAEYLRNGTAFIAAFTAYQGRLLLVGEAGHGQPFYYHFITTLAGCFPASAVAFAGARAPDGATERQATLHRWMIVTFSCVMIVFSLVTTKILHYVSLAYLPLAYFAAVAMYRARLGQFAPSRLYGWTLTAGAVVWGLAMIGLPLAMMWKDKWISNVTNEFTRANLLAPVAWSMLDLLPGAALLGGVCAMTCFISRRQWLAAHGVLFGSVGLATAILLPLMGPKIHEHVQGAAVRFYRLAGERNGYVNASFRSYAQYFYSRITPDRAAAGHDIAPGAFVEWLKSGAIDKPVYFISDIRRDDAAAARAAGALEENGYLLVTRYPPAPR